MAGGQRFRMFSVDEISRSVWRKSHYGREAQAAAAYWLRHHRSLSTRTAEAVPYKDLTLFTQALQSAPL